MGIWHDDMELEERLDKLIREGKVKVVRGEDGKITGYRMRSNG